MPEIVLQGKEYVYNQHLTVTHRPLVPQADKGVDEPILKGWLSTSTVDGEDMLRHNKWLCMM